MAEASLNDRMIITHENATYSEIQQTLAQMDGLADALEVREDELFKVLVKGTRYSVWLTHTIQKEKISTNSYYVEKKRKALVGDITALGGGGENHLRNIISARFSQGPQQPWQYACHPLLLQMLADSNTTAEKFIANMKGHIGRFRTHAREEDYSDGRRRNFTKLPHPIEYEAKGGEIKLETITVNKNVVIRFGGNSPQISIAGTQIPAMVAAALPAKGVEGLFDLTELNELLRDEAIDHIENHNGGCTINFEKRELVPMGDGAHVIDEEYDRIVAKLNAWAEKDPLPA